MTRHWLTSRSQTRASISMHFFSATNWYPALFSPGDKLWIMELIYKDNSIDLLKKFSIRVAKNNMSLVIRDWSHLDFISTQLLEYPPYRMSLKEMLHGNINLNESFIVRHPMSLYQSMVTSGDDNDYLKTTSGIMQIMPGIVPS